MAEIKQTVSISVPSDLYAEYKDKYGERQISSHVKDLLISLLGKRKLEQLQAEEYVAFNAEVKETINDLLNSVKALHFYESLSLVTFYNEVLKNRISDVEAIAQTDIGVLGGLIRYKKALLDFRGQELEADDED